MIEQPMLGEIGFRTLFEARVYASTGLGANINRAEVMVTNRCNFKCSYCKMSIHRKKGLWDMSRSEIGDIILRLCQHGCRTIRFTGGEPLLWPLLERVVDTCAMLGFNSIAVSTNGYASLETLKDLVSAGVNDFSISLDACCASDGNMISGIPGSWDVVTESIRHLSKLAYVTVGVVLTDANILYATQIVQLAHNLGVADIRLIPASSQCGDKQMLFSTLPVLELEPEILAAHPILRYRVNQAKAGATIRGLHGEVPNSPACGLVLDDLIISQGRHYPCPIYFREGGAPIGDFNSSFREQRLHWYRTHRTATDAICQHQCLDVCRQYNARHTAVHGLPSHPRWMVPFQGKD
jgi:molybdenum cofactor biosynthesis enzyme MoaA